MCIDPAKTYTATVETNKGTFTITLDPKAAPQTVNNFVALARYHYYDDTPCHRIITGFVVQCGDPTGKGTGGPGYEIPDELPQAGAVQARLARHGQLRRRTPTAASSSSSPATRARSCRPTTRCSAR